MQPGGSWRGRWNRNKPRHVGARLGEDGLGSGAMWGGAPCRVVRAVLPLCRWGDWRSRWLLQVPTGGPQLRRGRGGAWHMTRGGMSREEACDLAWGVPKGQGMGWDKGVPHRT